MALGLFFQVPHPREGGCGSQGFRFVFSASITTGRQGRLRRRWLCFFGSATRGQAADRDRESLPFTLPYHPHPAYGMSEALMKALERLRGFSVNLDSGSIWFHGARSPVRIRPARPHNIIINFNYPKPLLHMLGCCCILNQETSMTLPDPNQALRANRISPAIIPSGLVLVLIIGVGVTGPA
jgi:hypothetical protein